jgi:hypothetical protein
MRLGIFAKTFARPTVEDVFDAVRAHGLRCVQFNLSCAGVPSLPDEIAPSLITRIRQAAQSRDIEMAAVSGTYNMIHPDQEVNSGACADCGRWPPPVRVWERALLRYVQGHAIPSICDAGIQTMILPRRGPISYALWRLPCASLRKSR